MRWERVKTLFDEAVELPEGERAAFVEKACAGDASLLAEVNALLAADAGAGAFLEQPAAPRSSSWESGRVVGAWRLLRQLGEGGMGRVFLAERADGQYAQKVALKAMKASVSDEAHRRFARERQILARLEHPHIARLLDGGVEGDIPWFAMEYVDGAPITEHARSLPARAKVERMLLVCAAVQFAHRNLIVHRDLKPSNVLVTREGVVKLVDFGIAKLIDDDDPLHATRTRAIALTPEYAAPEQLSGGPVTTATDVYGLGLVLYELIGGARPFGDRAGATLTQAVLAEEPAAPSTLLPRETARAVRGDLDRIALACLEKAPERRYASVDALADDLCRYLTGLPLLARGSSRLYRMGRFVRRHRVGVAAASAVALAVIAGVSGTVWQARRADREARQARAVSDFISSVFSASDPSEAKGKNVTAKELLDRGAERVGKELAGEPEVQLRVLRQLGEVYLSIGESKRAEELARQQLELSRRLFGDGSLDAAQAKVAIADALWDQMRPQEADVLYAEGLAGAEKNGAGESPVAEKAIAGLRYTRYTLDDFKGAEAYGQRQMALALKMHGPQSTEYAGAVDSMGELYSDKGRWADGLVLAKQAAEIYRAKYGLEHPKTLGALFGVALYEKELGQSAEAAAVVDQILPLDRKLMGPSHQMTILAMRMRAWLYGDDAHTREADALLDECERSLSGEMREDAQFLATLRAHRATVRREMGDFEGELEFAQKSYDGLRARFGEHSSNAMYGGASLGWALLENGRYDEAEALLAPLDGEWENNHWRVGFLATWGEVARRAGRLDDARSRLARAVELAKKAGVEDTDEGLSARWRFALVDTGPWPAREAELRAVIAREQVLFAPDHPLATEPMFELAKVLAAQGQTAPARELFAKVVAGRERFYGAEHPRVAEAKAALAALSPSR